MQYIIQDKEAGNFIDQFNTLTEAQIALYKMEEEDKKDGTYTEDFYEIVEDDQDEQEEMARETLAELSASYGDTWI